MKRNTITIIELIIILCVIVVAVRVWGYRKPDSKIICNPTPTFTPYKFKKIPTVLPIPTLSPHKQEAVSKIRDYYDECCNNLDNDSPERKTLDWLNQKIPSSSPIPKGIVGAYDDSESGINVIFDDGQDIRIFLNLPRFPPGGLIIPDNQRPKSSY